MNSERNRNLKDRHPFLLFCEAFYISFVLCMNIAVPVSPFPETMAIAEKIRRLFSLDGPQLLIQRLDVNLPGNIVQVAVCFAGIFLLLWLFPEERTKSDSTWKRVCYVLLSFLLSIVHLFALSKYTLGNYAFIFANDYQKILSVLMILGYTMLYSLMIRITEAAILRKYPFGKAERQAASAENADKPFPRLKSFRKVAESFENRTGKWGCMGILLICYIPWLIAFFPGTLSWDSDFQITTFIRGIYTAHHPVLSTWIQGAFFKAGLLMGSAKAGLALYMLFQTAVCVYAFSEVLDYLRKKDVHIGIRISVLMFYGLTPVFGQFMQAILKDVLFTGVITLFFLCIVKCAFSEKLSKGELIRLAFYGVLSSLLRHNGTYIVLLSLFSIGIVRLIRKKGAGLLITFGIVTAVTLGFNAFTANVLGIEKGKTREAMGFPAQIVGNAIANHGEVLTEEDKADIEALFPDWNWVYVPGNADSSKDGLVINDSRDLILLMKLAGRITLRSKKAFVEVLSDSTFGYIAAAPNGTFSPPLKERFFTERLSSYADEIGADVSYVWKSEERRQVLKNLLEIWDRLPLLSLLQNCGFFTELILILSAVCFFTDRKKIIYAVVPLLLTVLSCMLSPLDESLRYFLPVMTGTPILAVFITREKPASTAC